MSRIGAIFVAICMVLIAGSTGAVALLGFGIDLWQAALVAVVVLVLLSLGNMVTTRLGDRGVVGDHIADLSRSGSDIARQMAALDRRLSAMEGKVDAAVARTRAATDPLGVELGELSNLVKQLAESVAAQDRLAQERAHQSATQPPVQASVPASIEPSVQSSIQLPLPTSLPGADFVEIEPTIQSASAPATGSATERLVSSLRDAIESNRIDLYLQPIVTLPQRKVRYYEALSRLRGDNGDAIPAADFVPAAEDAGLMPKIDNLAVFRCVQIVRRLLLKNREVGLFCNLSAATLTDATVFPQLVEFLEANRAIAPSLVLEFRHAVWRTMGPREHEALATLAQHGYRFSIDNVTDLGLQPRDLADRHVKFIKVPGNLLLNRSGIAPSSDIHPADLSDLMLRFGIDLIGDKIETEPMAIDLLDCDLRYGQGFLFSPPRPVRADALQGVSEPAPPVETAALPKQPAPVARSGLAQLATAVIARH